jgi:hypothetical protein
MKYLIKSLIIFSVFYSGITLAQTENLISSENGKAKFVLVEKGKASPICISSKDYPGVLKVAKLFQTDIKNVSEAQPEVLTDEIPGKKEIVIIGTIGKNPVIDKLISDKKINADEIAGKWETSLIEVVENPLPDVDRALVIAGSDKRGTIFGMFELSKQIGVSPWCWWADVPVKKQSNMFIQTKHFTSGEPKVKYRGIFINDEAPALSGWASEKFGGFNGKFYEKVFELILRMKGNFLWPAMWGRMFYVEDPVNSQLADEYGIVISTSHHEPMMRAHAEWQNYGKGKWNYETNDSVLRQFWREGIKRMGSNESVVTLAMRGDGDEAMSEESNISLLEKIVKDQRQIITEVMGKPAETIPQVWVLYKEVQDYYDKGMRVPDDVTLLLCDDNWGNIRRLPSLSKKPRAGGYGIYYHFDYVGGPRNYKWLNTNQIERVWEQMYLAYEYGARQIWVVNVGDIKPMEFPIEFFLDYAWNPENLSAEKLPQYYDNWTEEQFDAQYKNEIAEILANYTKYNSRRKPELLSPSTYSLTNYREAETVVTEYNSLLDKAEKISEALPENYKDAFYQLILHPVQACANLNELYFAAAKNYLYAKQKRAATNDFAERVKKLFERDADITNYFNKVMDGGKWNHMMDQTHIGYTYWQQPDSNSMPEIKKIDIPEISEMGIAIEGSENVWPEEKSEAILPEFDSHSRQNYYLEIFNKGNISFDYSVKISELFIKIDFPKGKIEKEKRLFVNVEWAKAPVGKNKYPITIKGANSSVTIYAVVNNPVIKESDYENCFVESNGCISIEAEHYFNAAGTNEIKWLTIPNFGRTLSGITTIPVTSQSQIIGKDCPRVEYKVYFTSPGEANVNLYFSPTLNFTNKQEGVRYAVSFDDEQPQIIKLTCNPNPPDLNRDPVWNKWVADNINIQISKHEIVKSGKHILKFWMIDPGVVLQKIVIDKGGMKQSYLGPAESFRNGIGQK